MKCSCCGKKKRLFESFEELDDSVNVCVECSQKLYKYQDYMKEKNETEAKKILAEVNRTQNTPEFAAWRDAFLCRFEHKEKAEQTETTIAKSSENKKAKIEE